MIIREAIKKDMPVIHELAHEIWPLTYGSILSKAQLNYMLELIYSESSLQKQFNENHNFLIIEEDKKAIAFADYGLLNGNENIYKLHKLYVSLHEQGKGIGKLLIEYVVEKIKHLHATELVLNVNRNNKAKNVYEHLGFAVLREENIDIGEGYFMNDYIMQLKLN